MSDAHVSWLFELAVREGRDAEFRALMDEMAQATKRDESRTLAYEWYLSEDGRRLHLWERYVDEAAALAHLRTFQARFAKRFFDVLQPERITLYGASLQAVREAMAALQPTIMTRVAGFSRHPTPPA